MYICFTRIASKSANLLAVWISIAIVIRSESNFPLRWIYCSSNEEFTYTDLYS